MKRRTVSLGACVGVLVGGVLALTGCEATPGVRVTDEGVEFVLAIRAGTDDLYVVEESQCPDSWDIVADLEPVPVDPDSEP